MRTIPARKSSSGLRKPLSDIFINGLLETWQRTDSSDMAMFIERFIMIQVNRSQYASLHEHHSRLRCQFSALQSVVYEGTDNYPPNWSGPTLTSNETVPWAQLAALPVLNAAVAIASKYVFV